MLPRAYTIQYMEAELAAPGAVAVEAETVINKQERGAGNSQGRPKCHGWQTKSSTFRIDAVLYRPFVGRTPGPPFDLIKNSNLPGLEI